MGFREIPHYRYQWNLKRLTPVEYRDQLLQAM
ncbi:IS3 family transposase [Paenibacillus sp. JNUCC31]